MRSNIFVPDTLTNFCRGLIVYFVIIILIKMTISLKDHFVIFVFISRSFNNKLTTFEKRDGCGTWVEVAAGVTKLRVLVSARRYRYNIHTNMQTD